jgi:fibronectin-binding autotransporter adhesin
MAQSGFTPISLYFSATGAAVPLAADLVAGELALNTNDGKLYFKNSSGVVTLLAGSSSGPAGGSTTQVQYNNAGVLAGITGATTNGTALTLVAPVLGTPASGVVTNLTGTASININGTVGATTANTGAFTTVAASGKITSTVASGKFIEDVSGTTSNLYAEIRNTTGWLITGVESSAGGSLITGGSAYAGIIATNSASNFEIGVNGTKVATFTSAGFNGVVGGSTPAAASVTTLIGSGGVGSGATAATSTFNNFIYAKAASGGAAVVLQDTGVTSKFELAAGATGANAFGIYDTTASAYRVIINSTGGLTIGSTAGTGSGALFAGAASVTTLGATGTSTLATVNASGVITSTAGTASVGALLGTGTVAGDVIGAKLNNDSSTGVVTSSLAFTNSGVVKGRIQAATSGNGFMKFFTNADTLALTLDASQNAQFAGTLSAGATTANGLLTVNTNGGTLPAVVGGESLRLAGANAATNRVLLDSFGGVTSFTFRRANTSLAAPSAIQSGDNLAFFSTLGYGATAYNANISAAFAAQAAENWTDSAIGSKWIIQAAPIGGTTRTTIAEFSSGATALTGTLSATGNVSFTTSNSVLDIGSTTLTQANYGLINVGGTTGGMVKFAAGTTQRGEVYGNTGGIALDTKQASTNIDHYINSVLVTRTNTGGLDVTGTITSTGALTVGTTIITGAASAYALRVTGNASSGQCALLETQNTAAGTAVADVWHYGTTGDNTFLIFYTEGSPTARGSITYNRAGGLTAYNTTSDYRSKDITGKYEASGETIDQLQVYMGKMKGATIARPMMIAHEAASVVPYAVTGEKDAEDEDGKPIYQSIDHQIFVPLLIAEVQALRSRVALLERN